MSTQAPTVGKTAKIYVVALTHQAFTYWLHKNNIPLDRRAVFVSHPDHLQGLVLAPAQVRFVPGWTSMPNAKAIEQAAHAAMSKMSRK